MDAISKTETRNNQSRFHYLCMEVGGGTGSRVFQGHEGRQVIKKGASLHVLLDCFISF